MNLKTNSETAASAATANPGLPSEAGTVIEHFPQARGESERAYEAFRVYLELGPRRRYVAVGRKIGVCLRTVKNWARDFDWRGRIKTYTGLCLQTAAGVQREEILDAAARARSLRERQQALAEAILDAAERYLERVDDDDLDQMNFADACKALEIASRVGQRAEIREFDDAPASGRNLRDQLASLLDQAYGEPPARNGNVTPPSTATATPAGGQS